MLNAYKLDNEMLKAIKTQDKSKQNDIFNKYIQRTLNNNPVVILCSKYKRGV